MALRIISNRVSIRLILAVQITTRDMSRYCAKQVPGTVNKVKCMYTNVRSLVNKRDELELGVKQSSYDIIGFWET